MKSSVKRSNSWKYHPAQKRLKLTVRSDAYKVQCCKCEKHGYYLDLQDAYDHGWFAQDYREYCPDHAQDGIWEADYEEISDDPDVPEEYKCCLCDKHGYYLDLQEAYDHGWFQYDDAEYCSDHAQQGIWEADYGEVYTILKDIIKSI